MIFVTVGTHEQQFNRLIKEIDRLKGEGEIKDSIFIQTGFSDYIPVNCEWKQLISYSDMRKKIKEARIVITHGGPASFLEVLTYDKIPIVIPRLSQYNEHINNHQLEFSKRISSRGYNIILVESIKDLNDRIENYESYNGNFKSNNNEFVSQFSNIIKELTNS